MATLLSFLLFLSIISNSAAGQIQSNEESFISAVISEKGLNFVKDPLIEKAVKTLTPLGHPDIEKNVKILVVVAVHMAASNIALLNIDVSSSTVRPGEWYHELI
ncbi:putative BPI/LBP family protein [Cocos nucifera]|uniref:Putative BPI/LBP family protein n=1 Tax=Cocos nucifera TaxID=13894 RepID=A0A8K0IHV9_COCNU|nr:putative BPI/LBP family protein [Cocos nucifera]